MRDNTEVCLFPSQKSLRGDYQSLSFDVLGRHNIKRNVAQSGSVVALEAIGRRFKSCRSDHLALVMKLVDNRVLDTLAFGRVGSNPTKGTN